MVYAAPGILQRPANDQRTLRSSGPVNGLEAAKATTPGSDQFDRIRAPTETGAAGYSKMLSGAATGLSERALLPGELALSSDGRSRALCD